MNYPKYAQIEDRLYEINTDFKVAIRCNEVSQDETISDEERAMAIIYLLFVQIASTCSIYNSHHHCDHIHKRNPNSI